MEGMNKEGLLFVVSGASGTGKTTLCREMVKVFPDLKFSISHTTRPRRPGDEEGRDYFFVSPEEFQRMIDRGDFVEWAEIYGHRYGTSQGMLQEARARGMDLILDIDVQGAAQLKQKNLPGIFVFLFPPSMTELKRRLMDRRTEGKEALSERLRKARDEIAEARWYDYLLTNDDLETAKQQLRSIITAEYCRRERQLEQLEKLMAEK